MLDRRKVVGGLAAIGICGTSGRLPANYVNERIAGPGYVVSGAKWLLGNFGAALKAKTDRTPFSYQLLCAMAYQESGYFWWRKRFLSGKSPAQILRLIVLDDVAPRTHAYPRDTAEFEANPRYAELSADLIAASNAARAEQGLKARRKLRFGYGIFQNDLQNIRSHPEFWNSSLPESPDVKGLWGDLGVCADYCIHELQGKYEMVGHDVDQAIRAYNGNGVSADIYLHNVRVYEQAILKAGL